MRFSSFCLLLTLSTPPFAAAQSVTESWEFALTPFLWGSGMDGTIGLAGREQDFEASAQDLLGALDFGVMGNFEGRRGRWSLATDVVYTDLGKDVVVENPDAATRNPRIDLRMTILEGDVGYRVAPSLDVLAGLRGVSTSVRLEADGGTLSEADKGFVDPIVGARFRRYLSEKLWVNVRGDVGGFGAGSDFSWFASATGGYRLSRHLSLDFGYRLWGFDYEGDDDLRSLDLTLAGFGAGVTFHF